VFSAISAITPGSTSSTKVRETDGPCTTDTPSASVPLGRPIQSASPTKDHAHTRSCSTGIATPVASSMFCPGSAVFTGPNTASKIHDTTKPKISARKTAMRDQKPGSSTAAHTRNVAVSRATH
jgi:hypothetical protein